MIYRITDLWAGVVRVEYSCLDLVEDEGPAPEAAHHHAHRHALVMREPAHADSHRGDQGYGLQCAEVRKI